MGQLVECTPAPGHLVLIELCTEHCAEYLQLLELPESVAQQLTQQVVAATEQLKRLPEATETTALAQQLRSFAQAVAGRIPLSTACNNPGCSNLQQRSELVLVGGKSCVCARCKAAR
jgi:hypothetical protein